MLKKIVRILIVAAIGTVLTIGTMGLYNYFKEKRS